ncbi:MAG: response regulator, partial [Gemmataceae bacterium]
GYRWMATTIGQALQLGEQWRPDVVFLDLNLQGTLDGFLLGQQLRSVVPDACLVALSGSVREEIVDRLESVRFDGFLSKPVDLQDLLPFCQG